MNRMHCHGSVKNILLDFDGTVVNSHEGIFWSLEQTFAELHRPMPPRENLRWMIGPGITAVMDGLFPDDTAEYRSDAIKVFRKYYDTTGYQKTTLYDGIVELLTELPQWGYRTYLTTMKGRPGTEQIVRYFHLEKYFVARHAYDPYGPPMVKHELLAGVIKQEQLSPSDTIVIGDTAHDVTAARKNGMDCIAVAWGYSSESELREIGAETIARTVGELKEMLKPL